MAAVASEIAARQHAVVKVSQLVAAGGSASTIDRWVRVGHLHRLHPGVLSLVPPSLLTDQGRWLAAVLACGEGAVLSHGPAAQLAGIGDRQQRTALHVSLPGRRRVCTPGVTTHRPRHLEPIDVTRRQGIPATTRTRTVWDLAYSLTPVRLRRVFEQAHKHHDLDRLRLTQLLAAAPSRRGSRALRELLAEGTVPLWRTRSLLEDIVLVSCRDGGLPLPDVNVPLLGFEVDFLWQAERFVVEADGGDHLFEHQRDRDNARDLTLGRAGFLVRRYSWTAAQDGRAVASVVLAILRERAPGRVAQRLI